MPNASNASVISGASEVEQAGAGVAEVETAVGDVVKEGEKRVDDVFVSVVSNVDQAKDNSIVDQSKDNSIVDQSKDTAIVDQSKVGIQAQVINIQTPSLLQQEGSYTTLVIDGGGEEMSRYSSMVDLTTPKAAPKTKWMCC